jgi:predicted nucleotide-binding protein (sugar kinase/HSP70/actin superfamily)
MKALDNTRVTFPHLGSYCVPIELLFTQGMGVDYVTPPPITNHTLEIGSRYSPDFVCSPFKYNLGNYLEAIDAGANTLAQVGGACRLGYYGELHEQILRDMGFTGRFVNMAKARFDRPTSFYNQLKAIKEDLPLARIGKILPVVLKMVEYIDEAEDYVRRNVGFETHSGAFEKAQTEYLEALRGVRSMKQLRGLHLDAMKGFKEIGINKPDKPLRVGIIGEYYTIMLPFSNHFIEKELAKKGMVVDRWMNLTNSLLHNTMKEAKEKIRGYAEYDMGATCMMTIERALYCAKKGYDGIIHVKSFGCTPEIDVIPVLQNISADYKLPILYFSYDSQTSDAGIHTRLEAFHDMIMMRKEAK